MKELSKPLENESVGDYIKRLLANNEIVSFEIPMAVANFNKK